MISLRSHVFARGGAAAGPTVRTGPIKMVNQGFSVRATQQTVYPSPSVGSHDNEVSIVSFGDRQNLMLDLAICGDRLTS